MKARSNIKQNIYLFKNISNYIVMSKYYKQLNVEDTICGFDYDLGVNYTHSLAHSLSRSILRALSCLPRAFSSAPTISVPLSFSRTPPLSLFISRLISFSITKELINRIISKPKKRRRRRRNECWRNKKPKKTEKLLIECWTSD